MADGIGSVELSMTQKVLEPQAVRCYARDQSALKDRSMRVN
jgi:hypothetical protein